MLRTEEQEVGVDPTRMSPLVRQTHSSANAWLISETSLKGRSLLGIMPLELPKTSPNEPKSMIF